MPSKVEGQRGGMGSLDFTRDVRCVRAWDDEADCSWNDVDGPAFVPHVFLSEARGAGGAERSPACMGSLGLDGDDGYGFTRGDDDGRANDVSSRSHLRICVSACLLGERCKYDGGSNLVPGLGEWLAARGCEVIIVCPEVLGGLTTPRVPAEISCGRVLTAAGDDVTAAFERGVDRALVACGASVASCADGSKAATTGVDCAILQPRSPSCGVGRIYDGTFSGRLVAGDGLFARELIAHGVPVISADAFDA